MEMDLFEAMVVVVVSGRSDEASFSKLGFLVEASNNRTNDFRATRQSNLIFVIRF